MIFHADCFGSKRRFTQASLSAFSICVNIVMSSPPSPLLPIMVFFFIFAGLLSQMNLKVILSTFSAKLSGIHNTEALKVSLDKAKVLVIFIFPYKEMFLFFQEDSVCLIGRAYCKSLIGRLIVYHKGPVVYYRGGGPVRLLGGHFHSITVFGGLLPKFNKFLRVNFKFL